MNVLLTSSNLTDGERVANSTLIEALLGKDFLLVINDVCYNVCPPEKGKAHSSASRFNRSS